MTLTFFCLFSPSGGSAWGSVGNTETLIEGAKYLLSKGCTAIAVVVRFPEDDEGGTRITG
jgi:Protein of unknown function (DUF3326)